MKPFADLSLQAFVNIQSTVQCAEILKYQHARPALVVSLNFKIETLVPIAIAYFRKNGTIY